MHGGQFPTETEDSIRMGEGCGGERMRLATEPKMSNLLNGGGGIVRTVLQVGKASQSILNGKKYIFHTPGKQSTEP